MTQAAAVARALSDKERVAFCAVYPVAPDFTLPADFDPSSTSGLTLCHLTRSSAPTLVCYWRDESSYRAYEGALRRRLGVAAPLWDGFAVDVRAPKSPWWKPTSVRTLLLAIAATFGALSGIRDYFAVLIAAPDVLIANAESGRLNAVEGEQVVAPITVVSSIRYTPARIQFETPFIEAAESRKRTALQMEVPVVPSLAAGQSLQLRVIGTTPPHSPGKASPDVYDISVKARANAGLLGWMWTRTLELQSRKLWVWPNRLGIPPPAVSAAAGKTCELTGTVYAPRAYPQGLRGEVVMTSEPRQVLALGVSAAGVTEVTPEQDTSHTVTTLSFRTAAIDRFQVYPYVLTVALSGPVTKSTCENWAGRVQVAFE
jgi:hypothetical protein